MCSTVEKRVVQQYRVLFSLPHHATTHTFRKNLSRKAAPRSTDLQVSVKYIQNEKKYKKIKTLPALPPPSNRYAQTAAPSSLPACATDLFLFRHFSLASPGQCQVNLLQKKENKTQNTKHKEATALGALPLNLHQSTATRTDRSATYPPTAANTFTQKKRKNCPPSSESNRVATLVVRPSLGGRRVLAPLSSSSSTIKSGRHRTAPPPCM